MNEQQRAAKRAYYLANKDRCKANSARTRAKNPDATKVYAAAYYARNREAMLAQSAEWRKAHPGAAQAHQRKWLQKNPDYYSIKEGRRRAQKKGRVSRNIRAVLMEQQGGMCVYCKAGIEGGSHLDHIMPLALGGAHEDWNMQLTCPSCNLKKRDKHPDVFAREIGLL